MICINVSMKNLFSLFEFSKQKRKILRRKLLKDTEMRLSEIYSMRESCCDEILNHPSDFESYVEMRFYVHQIVSEQIYPLRLSG